MWASLALVLLAAAVWRRAIVSRTGAALAAAGVLAGLLLSLAYAVIDRLTGSGIDASVLYHLRAGLDGAGMQSFAGLAAGAAGAALACLVAAALAYRLIRTDNRLPLAGLRLLAGLALLAGGLWLNPATADLVRLTASARQAATPAGLPPPGFVPVARAGFTGEPRNFVLLYLESVERSYLDETRFPGLMPNLAALEAEAVSFIDLTEVEEAGWTIAGMVASQCGMPLIASGAGMDRFLPGATCLGDLLAREGYALAYIGGADLGFAGKGTFYDSHGFSLVEGRTQLEPRLADPSYINDWGLFDDSLYPEARARLEALAAGDAPFGLVMLTLDTHHPFGFASRSCADAPYGDGTNPFLNAVHCADRLAADFIREIRSNPAFADTVLVVASDHLAMPNLAEALLEAGPRRNLMMVFAPDLAPARIDTPGTTLDIGPTLLGLIGAPTPALGYGRDLLAGAPTLRLGEPGLEALIAEGRGWLAAMWSYPQIDRGLTVDVAAGEVVLGDRRLKYPVLFQLDDTLSVTAIDFEASDDITLTERVADLSVEQHVLWIDRCVRTATFAPAPPPEGAELCLLAGSLASPDLRQIAVEDGIPIPRATLTEPFTRSGADVAFHDLLLADLNRRRQFATGTVIDYTPPNGLTGAVAIRSAGYLTGASWVVNPAQGERVGLMRGLTLLGLTAEGAPVKLGHADTCGYAGRQTDKVPLEAGFQDAITANAGRFGGFVIVAHNSVVCYEIDPGLEPLFAGTGLTAWRDLWYEEPYVALIAGNGAVQEFTGPRQTALGLNLTDILRPVRSDAQRRLDWLPRIAHAGGAWQGRTYTNAMEALEANGAAYEVIEIDLAWTADDRLICLHDWDAPFLAVEGVPPAGPLSFDEVMARAEARAGFTPCTLKTLVDWLAATPGVRVVLDLKSGAMDAYRTIAATYPDLRPRLIPQFYQPQDYGALRDLGYQDVIWTLYQYAGDDASVLAALRGMDLLGLAMPPERLAAGLARKARAETGVLSWVHTINTQADLDAAVQAGAAEVFTDVLVPGRMARFEAVSVAGFDRGESGLRAADGTRLTFPRGVNLVDLGPAPRLIASFDGCAALDTGTPPDPAPFHAALTAAVAEGRAVAVIVHDSAFCEDTAIAPLFVGTPLTVAPGIGFRQPYIGLIRPGGRVLEFTGSEDAPLRETLTVEAAP